MKAVKAKVSDIDKMKVEEQKKAVRSGYDMDILPPDLVTYSQDAKTCLLYTSRRQEKGAGSRRETHSRVICYLQAAV